MSDHGLCLNMCVNSSKIRYCHVIDSVLGTAHPAFDAAVLPMCWAGAPSKTRE